MPVSGVRSLVRITRLVMAATSDLHVVETRPLVAPALLHQDLPIHAAATETVASARQRIQAILRGDDQRLLVVVGPCSVHDVKAAREYAQRLAPIRERLKDQLEVVMRVYFEKPRTTVGWKGLINDPDLDDSFNINKGLHLARQLLMEVNALGLPTGTEYLDLISPQYIADLVAWGAIGARTTESQSHRELASGLSCPVGFKNATNGDVQIAVDAIGAAQRPHHFLSVTKQGQSAIFQTAGNEDCHIILRGGRSPNYDMFSVDDACKALDKAKLQQVVMIDASHANSRKIPARQAEVAADIATQVRRGNRAIIGVMLESFIEAGRQDVVPGQALVYGQSITDPCMDWETTEAILADLATAVQARRQN